MLGLERDERPSALLTGQRSGRQSGQQQQGWSPGRSRMVPVPLIEVRLKECAFRLMREHVIQLQDAGKNKEVEPPSLFLLLKLPLWDTFALEVLNFTQSSAPTVIKSNVISKVRKPLHPKIRNYVCGPS